MIGQLLDCLLGSEVRRLRAQVRALDGKLEVMTDQRDEWKVRAQRAEREAADISDSLARSDEKWRQVRARLSEYEERDGSAL